MWGKSLAAALLGLPLTTAVIGLITLSWPGRPEVITLPWLLLSFPLWILVMSAAFSAQSGRRAWAWMAGLTAGSYGLLHLLKLLGWVQVAA
ncbi:hypothetical protein [Roseateles amylovorans]|uniref:Transmembrane protein n=1 Tax=Roseateles amylovorans TaxID=2978473 RepID=A0ABY6AUI0_9BURK|nr:hypothetical protein [Roseateles amylovorans]UXH76230.1 hypothetical protein N4261_14245 [Roseateles amylovorans]